MAGTTAAQRVSGSAVDRPLVRRRMRWPWITSGIVLLGIFVILLAKMPRGLRIVESQIRVATVVQGAFRDDVLVRSTAEPLHTIMLDVLESGRVEEVLAKDGSQVLQGALLFRLSNPQLRLNLVAREADRAQQVANLSALRISVEAAKTEHRRRLLDLRFEQAQAERYYTRSEALIKSGIISMEAFENSRDRLERQRQSLDDEKARNAVEMQVKQSAIRQLQQAVNQLDAGLQLVNESIDALSVRAPIAGRLTDFHLQLGEITRPEQRVGRIDDPTQFKLVAQIDEYFLGKAVAGKQGAASVNGKTYPVEVSRILPQIRDGQFQAELLFKGDVPPAMSPGQSAEIVITIGGLSTRLVLPNDAFVSEDMGAGVFLLAPDGLSAVRRKIGFGRRNADQVEVTSGLVAGDRVIVSGYASFGSAERLQIDR